MSKKKTTIISLIILLVGAVVTTLIFKTEPTAERGGATKKTAMLVETTTVKRDTFLPTIVATGLVQAAQDIVLAPQVGGKIISIASDFEPGAPVSKGQSLIRINPADYQNRVLQQKSQLRQATADLSLEEGRKNAAEEGYKLLGDSIVGKNKSLVLREPQYQSALARVESAEANLRQAELDLSRTRLVAPFNGMIVSRSVNLGSQVATGDNLGRLVGTDEYWISLNLPLSNIQWIELPERVGDAADVRIYNPTTWADSVFRMAKVKRLVGALDNNTRLASLLVSVKQPLGYEGKPGLVLGSFVEAHIQAKPIKNVVKLNRDFLRKNETAWVMNNGKLEIRNLEIVFQDRQYAYVSKGLKNNEQVVITNLATVVEGSPLRTEKNEE